MPNYTAAAEEWDAVTLTLRAYLLLSGNPLPVEVNRDAGAHTRSGEALCLLAGWSPGETYWLSSDVQFSTSPVTWTLAEDGRIVDAQL